MEHNEVPTPKSSMHENILERIRTDTVHQVSKSHFVLKMIFTIAVAIVTLLVSISIFNFILFGLRIHHHELLLGFGLRGLWTFALLFPWGLLAVDMLLVALLEWLLRQFRFGYRVPILYLLGILLIVTVSCGVIIDRATSFNDGLLGQADAHQLPPLLNELYEGMRVPPPPESGVCKCVITAINGSTLTAYNEDQGTSTTYKVQILQDGDTDADDHPFKIGDTIFIAGDEQHNVIRAFGVRHFSDDFGPPSPQQIATSSAPDAD